jgi:hypothetical protein
MNSFPLLARFGLLAGLLLVLAGCNSVPPHVLQLTSESEKDRELQTRRFDGIRETELLSAGAGVVQDLGFTLDESESKLGLITASRKLTSRRPMNSREVMGDLGWVMLFSYFGALHLAYDAATGVKEPQIVRVSLVTTKAGADATSVRVTAQRVVYADESQAKIKTVEPLNDPAFYLEFFRRLSQSVFLETPKHAL